MTTEVKVTGLAELQRFLDELPRKLQENVMRGALRAGMNVVLPAVKSGVHSVSGKLAEGLKVGTRSRGHIVTANIKTSGPHGFVARWVEFGTAPHFIYPKEAGGALRIHGSEQLVAFAAHPGATPKPFMRPALDSRAQAAVIATAEYTKQRLATKEGLDTSGVVIEGDE